MTDYLGAFLADPKDIKHYGVPGMKWGVRRSRSALAGAASARKAKKAAKSEKGESDSSGSSGGSSSGSGAATKPAGNIQDNVESSSARYARLAGQAKAGQAGAMTEQDLKFFNARTDALTKINKMNEVKPSWLRETTTKVVQQSAQRQMQTVADALADKYVGDPIKAALGGAAAQAQSGKGKVSIKGKVADAASKVTDSKAADTATTSTAKTVAKTVSDSVSTSKPNPKTMRFEDALDYFTKNSSETPVVPDGYSPNAAKIFLDEITKRRGS